jgi:glucose-6-phosphate isomerase
MKNIDIDIQNVIPFVSEQEIFTLEPELKLNFNSLLQKTGKGNDFVGWINLPSSTERRLLEDISQAAEKIRQLADVFVVIGIGGSYLGARAVIEALKPPFSDLQKEKKDPVIIYAGHHISEDYLSELLRFLDDHDYAITVISKSGTTTEPAIAFRLLKNHLEAKYGKQNAAQRIIAITDKEKGALKKLADEEGYKTFEVPDDVGGRYSVLTPVGLLPIAVAGFDISQLITGARNIEELCVKEHSIGSNPVFAYAAARNALYSSGKQIEILVNYLPNLQYFTEWWKQLYGESEGKEGKGIFPAGVNFTTDLHSMGQYIQDGLRTIFETVISVKQPNYELTIPPDADNLDKLNFLAGKRINDVNLMAEIGTTLAHVDGGVPNIRIEIPRVNEEYLGELLYFFEIACGLSGYQLGVNPFDQPGVEAYKKNMFALLGKPGFVKETEDIKKRLNL